MHSTRLLLALFVVTPFLAHSDGPPVIESRRSPILEKDGARFRDLNKNGVRDPYKDWRLPVNQRVTDLAGRMSAGLMIHASLAGFTGPNGEVLGVPAAEGRFGAGVSRSLPRRTGRK
jgi:hypothetical protein